MKLQGKIKTIIFKGERVSVLLEDARIFTDAQKWEAYTDIELVKDGEYKKGETWLSSFKKHIYQACEELKKMGKGIEVDVEVIVGKAGFKNIETIALAVPEVDVNADLKPPDVPEEEPEWTEGLHSTMLEKKPSSTQRSKDSPEAVAERMLKEEKIEEQASRQLKMKVESIAVDKDTLIIRQTCIKAAGMSQVAIKPEEIVEIAKRLEKFVLEGK